ncbi:MAG: Cna B-type domain-containing protein, partial [Clostridia bacterium]|nr:Cna B-type domain-containing protein [Clostridia bacterium]
ITNTFTVPTDIVTLTASKTWEDNEDYAQKRPDSVIVVVLNGETQVQEKTLSEDNDWKCEFTNLPKYDSNGQEINYTLAEKESTLGELYFYETEVDNGNIKITNYFRVPDIKVSLTATKVWEDNSNAYGKRPSSIIIELYANGVYNQSYTITNALDSDTQTYTFNNLPKYDELGNVISYTIDEKEVNTGDLYFYSKNVNGGTITNTFKVPDEKITYTVNKVWEDNSNIAGKRPNTITVELYANGVYREETTITNTRNGDSQSYTFENLPKYDSVGNEIEYTVKESETAVGDLKFYTSNVDSNTITNTFTVPQEETSVTVTKVWDDESNRYSKRPNSLVINLYADGNFKESYTITNALDSDIQEVLFENLTKYNELGNEIVYTVDEEELNTGDLKFYKKNINGHTITNTFEVPDEKVSITATKKWVDVSTIRRPEKLKLLLKDGDTVVREQIIDVDENETQSYEFIDLPKYDSEGNEKVYTVDEEVVNENDLYFYEKTAIDNATNTITNTFVLPDDKISITVTKIWEDNENA